MSASERSLIEWTPGRQVVIEWDVDKSKDYGRRTAIVLGVLPAPGGSMTAFRLSKAIWLLFPRPRRIRYAAIRIESGYFQVVSGEAKPSGSTVYAEIYGIKYGNLERPSRKGPARPFRLQPRDLVWMGFADVTPM